MRSSLPLQRERETVPTMPLPGKPTGYGVGLQHHGEVLQGVLRIQSEEVPCLVSFQVRTPGSLARFERNRSGHLTVWPEHKLKAARAAAICLARFDCHCSGHLTVDCQVPVGLGLGSSTADVVAAIVASADAFGLSLTAQQIAHIAVEAEQAIDPIMFDTVVLFAQRKGEILECLGSWFPEFWVLSVDLEPSLAGIDTLAVPSPRYSPAERARFDAMVARVRKAFADRDARSIAEVATASAEMNQARLPLSRFGEVLRIADKHAALGVQVSHSGTIAGMLFERQLSESDLGLISSVKADLARTGAVLRGAFSTGMGGN